MDSYVKHMRDGFSLEDRMRVATYYEGKSEWSAAGE